MSKPKNVSEVLEEFDKGFISVQIGLSSFEPLPGVTGNLQTVRGFIRSAISELLDGVVPHGGYTSKSSFQKGFDDCRSEVIKRVEEAKK